MVSGLVPGLGDDRAGVERLVRYRARPPLALVNTIMLGVEDLARSKKFHGVPLHPSLSHLPRQRLPPSNFRPNYYFESYLVANWPIISYCATMS